LYKLLLCWRYLWTRYLALACIVSVMLGVATLIVVNSVMAGFSTKLRERLHGLLSDVVVEAITLEGFSGPDEKMDRIRRDPYLADKIEAMSPTLECYAMLQYRLPSNEIMTRMVKVIGIDIATRGALGGFQEHLVKHKDHPTFDLPPGLQAHFARRFIEPAPPAPLPDNLDPNGEPPPPPPPEWDVKIPRGIIVGNLIASFRKSVGEGEYQEQYLLDPGDTVLITAVGGQRLRAVQDEFVVVDFFKSEMSEYDNNYVFAPLDFLQHLRTMQDRVTSIQIKLKNYNDAPAVVERLQKLFPASYYRVETWEKKQGPLLSAIAVERGILNVLLFLIIAVAGFGILAIFSMIVTEKTRDIGILKALGASNRGVMAIFLGYGLLLGVVGAGLGTFLGLELTEHINDVEHFLSTLTGRDVFPRDVYYFSSIPTDIQPFNVVLLNLGAVAIAVFFSVLPALRAAMLHPVRALRYE
jgi:lipoprotein-releasing system permease protein